MYGRSDYRERWCTSDAGRSLGAALQEEPSNHPKVRRSRPEVLSLWERRSKSVPGENREGRKRRDKPTGRRG